MIQCDHLNRHRKLYMLVVKKKEMTRLIIDRAWLGDNSMNEKNERIDNYDDFNSETRKFLSLKQVGENPAGISALESINKQKTSWIKKNRLVQM